MRRPRQKREKNHDAQGGQQKQKKTTECSVQLLKLAQVRQVYNSERLGKRFGLHPPAGEKGNDKKKLHSRARAAGSLDGQFQ